MEGHGKLPCPYLALLLPFPGFRDMLALPLRGIFSFRLFSRNEFARLGVAVSNALLSFGHVFHLLSHKNKKTRRSPCLLSQLQRLETYSLYTAGAKAPNF